MPIDLLVHSARQVLTLAGGPQRGSSLGRLGIIEDGAVAIDAGKIVAVGDSSDVRGRFQARDELDATDRVVTPGWVDPHTHLVWAGDRAEEFEQRQAGVSYMDILAAGGGILSTVRRTRAASPEDLAAQTTRRITRMLTYGTTTAEAKTGYGLAWEPELKTLEVILNLDEKGPIELVPTFLAAHALPPEFEGRPNDYVDEVIGQMLPALLSWWRQQVPQRPRPFVDVFCEEGAFDLAQSRRLLEGARALGFPLKIHADEFAGLGGAGLAAELGAVSADHLVHTPARDIQALGASGTVAVALPCTPFGLSEPDYTPARALLESDALLALATDLNPGTAWCESMPFAMALACRKMGLTPAQAIAAATINAAAAIGRQDQIGSLEPDKQADLLILDVPDYRHLGYRFGANLVAEVVKRGQIVVARGAPIFELDNHSL